MLIYRMGFTMSLFEKKMYMSNIYIDNSLYEGFRVSTACTFECTLITWIQTKCI